MIPTGRLMKNTQRQLKLSVSQPPRVGPMIGPTMIPAPHSAIAWPCFSRGLMSSMKVCASGTMAAPKTPWSTRKATIEPSDQLSPQATEAATNPATEIRNSRFRPSRSAIHPVSAVTIAAATIYEVSTQLIVSAEAPRSACIDGSATFAIVVSSTCMIVASMIDSVISVLLCTSIRGFDSGAAALIDGGRPPTRSHPPRPPRPAGAAAQARSAGPCPR